jgi:serine kinase of HPr protein (carbohydrate metabolism regulator)
VILHAGLMAVRLGGAWRGVLITGSSGAGKSDLMLRALDFGFRMVADDRTLVWISDGRLFGRAPDILQGLLELRGVGITQEPCLPMCEICFAVRCEAPSVEVERAPEDAWQDIGTTRIPLLRAHALDASAPAKLSRALIRLGHSRRAA